MNVVIDTNVVVSAALKNRNPEAVILFVVEQPAFTWVASPAILTEYITVLRRPKFKLPNAIVHQWETTFATFVTLAQGEQQVTFPRDPTDAKFLACALAASASYLITGDRDFSEARKLGITTILSVSLFKQFVCDVWT